MNNSDKYPHVKIVDSIDIYAAIGLMYFQGLYGMNMHSTHILFLPKQGPPPFGATATKSRLRFHFICSHLCFYNPDTITERWKHDRFAAMREIFTECNKNFARALIPEDYLTIDGTLYPMRNQISFKQYNPDKPAKYEMLYKSINSARYPFTHQSHVYCGKPEQEPDGNYVSGTINYVKYLVAKFSEHQNLTGRNISMDRLYTSFEVANLLVEKKITILGTIQTSRVGIPSEIKELSNCELLSHEVYWEENGNYFRKLCCKNFQKKKKRSYVIYCGTNTRCNKRLSKIQTPNI